MQISNYSVLNFLKSYAMSSAKSQVDYSSVMKALPPEIRKKAIQIADRLIERHMNQNAAIRQAIKTATEVIFMPKTKLTKSILW